MVVIAVVFIATIAVLSYRMLGDGSQLLQEAQVKRSYDRVIAARRGTIFDRNGNALALSENATSIYLDGSSLIGDPLPTALALHDVFGGSVDDYVKMIKTSQEDGMAACIVDRGAPELAEKLKAKDDKLKQEFKNNLPKGESIPWSIPTALSCINYVDEFRRVYPCENTGAQIVGNVNYVVNGTSSVEMGVSGLELAYDEILRGVNGMQKREQGVMGDPFTNGIVSEQPAVEGQDIIVSLDMELQKEVETQLAAYGEERNCNNAWTTVLDSSNGEILAMASLPLYDRENITSEEAKNGATMAKAITVAYEPGSVIKAATAAAALEEGLLKPTDTVYCPEVVVRDEHTIKDNWARGDETMSFTRVLSMSSNVGIGLIQEMLGKDKLGAYFDRYGFAQPTHVDYPHEPRTGYGEIKDEKGNVIVDYHDTATWNAHRAMNISFGQNIYVTQLQVASFYGTIANDGVLMQPHFLMARPRFDVLPNYSAQTVMGKQAVDKLEDMLRAVVTEGTGSRASIEGYDVVGKTGTGEKVVEGAGGLGVYSQTEFIYSFAGYIDNSNSNIVCVASFDSPTDGRYDPPGPRLFNDIMRFAIARYMIEPTPDEPVPAEVAGLPEMPE